MGCIQRLVDGRAELVDRLVHPLEVVEIVGMARLERVERGALVFAEADDDGRAVAPELASVAEVVAGQKARMAEILRFIVDALRPRASGASR